MKIIEIKNKITKLVFGDQKELPLEKRILILVNFISLIIIFIGLISNLILDMNIWSTISLAIGMLILSGFYLYSRNSPNYQKSTFPLFVISIILIPILWIFNAGFDGNITSVIFIYFIVIYTVVNQNIKKYVLISYLLMHSGLVLLQFYYPNSVTPYDNIYQKFSDYFVGGFLYIFFVYFIIDTIIQSYKNENSKAIQINEELQAKNQEIAENLLNLKVSEENLRKSELKIQVVN